MLLGICPIDDQDNHRKQLLYKIFGWLVVFMMGFVVVSSSVRAFDYGTTELNYALYAIFPGVACLRVFVTLIPMIIFRQKVVLLLKNLQTCCDKSKF